VKEERSEQLLELLKKGQITEFNKLRGSGFLSLSDANLTRADLSDADLSGAYLRGAKNMPISKEEARERGAIVD
jgi:Pentapeptide repeats (8 copies)